MNNDQEDDDEVFSDDPQEQLKIENDILKLKLQAELGADFTGDEDLAPDIENIFLKNVIEFEQQFANTSPKTIVEILDNPVVGKEGDLTNEEIENALVNIEDLLEEKGIVVDYAAEYDTRTKYKFITEELFYKETTLIDIPGMTTHFIYEEFHPNHKLEIQSKAEKFFKHWEERSFDENSFELASELVLEDGALMRRDTLLQKFKWIFEAYNRFDNFSYSIENISFDVAEEGKGLGFAEGNVEYEAVLESGETERFAGAFKFYLQYDGLWGIFFFHWPGFKW